MGRKNLGTEGEAYKGITRAFEEIGVKAEGLNIIIHDVPKSNWGTRGEQASKLRP